MPKHQIKFYVDDDEKKRLDTIAKRCYMPTANYVKSTALGVRIRQPKEVFIYADSDEKKEPIEIEKEVIKPPLADEDKAVLENILEREDREREGFIRYDVEFNKQLLDMAKRLLGKENQQE